MENEIIKSKKEKNFDKKAQALRENLLKRKKGK